MQTGGSKGEIKLVSKHIKVKECSSSFYSSVKLFHLNKSPSCHSYLGAVFCNQTMSCWGVQVSPSPTTLSSPAAWS